MQKTATYTALKGLSKLLKCKKRELCFHCGLFYWNSWICSAGCGRTGALCAIDYTWNLLKRQVRVQNI